MADFTQQTMKINRKPMQQKPGAFHTQTGLDFCFLMDITGSMQNYVTGTLQALKELIKQLQGMFGLLIKIGFFGYRDFEKENPGEQQFDYIDLAQYDYMTINESKLYEKLNSITCSGGGDFAEDIRGAIGKACEVISWGGRMKYLILIADAPAHGIKYNDGNGDNYPDEKPLDDVLDQLIQKDIRLVILEVAKYTKTMVNEIKQFYQKRQRENYLEINELNATSVEEVAKKLSKCLTDTIQRNIAGDTIPKKY